MGLCRVCCVVVVFGVCVQAWKTEYTQEGREEGDVCHRQNGEVWICKKDKECDTLMDVLNENGKLKTCSWKDRTPILCCPPKGDPERIEISKSEEKCNEYSRLLCGVNVFALASAAKPVETVERKRRDSQSTVETTDPSPSTAGGSGEDGQLTTHIPSIPAIAGGRFTLASEFPSVMPIEGSEESDNNHPLEENSIPPADIAGGHLTEPTEFPSMMAEIDIRIERQNVQTEENKGSPVYPVLGIIGGRLTLPAGFPSMISWIDIRRLYYKSGCDRGVDCLIGGIFTPPTGFPSMALIGYGDADRINWQCGGSLISENFVLSAAHCVNTAYGLARWVRLGDLDLKSSTEDARPQTLAIVERVVHPGYRSPAFYNDVALFRLERAVRFDRYVRPACLHADLRDPPGRGTAAGWGKNETNGPRSSRLMQVDISFVPGPQCRRLVGTINKYLPSGVDTASMVCAGEPGKDTCQGDSGGPLVLPMTPSASRDCLARLVGVTSFGPRNCGMTEVPGAYVRVAHFRSWIEAIVWPE